MFENQTIICNNCVGARLYQKLNREFDNPFMWSTIRPVEFVYLINHFKDIDFKNRKIIKHGNTYSIVIDGKIELLFVHHIQNSKYSSPTRSSTSIDMYYNKMGQYLLECYDRRLKRMKGEPVFVVNDKEYKKEYTFSDPNMLKHVKTDYPIIYSGEKNPNVPYIQYVHTLNEDTDVIAQKILKEICIR